MTRLLAILRSSQLEKLRSTVVIRKLAEADQLRPCWTYERAVVHARQRAPQAWWAARFATSKKVRKWHAAFFFGISLGSTRT